MENRVSKSLVYCWVSKRGAFIRASCTRAFSSASLKGTEKETDTIKLYSYMIINVHSYHTYTAVLIVLYIYPKWGLYHSNWVGFNYHKLPCLEGALIFKLDLHSKKEARHLLAREGQMGRAH